MYTQTTPSNVSLMSNFCINFCSSSEISLRPLLKARRLRVLLEKGKMNKFSDIMLLEIKGCVFVFEGQNQWAKDNRHLWNWNLSKRRFFLSLFIDFQKMVCILGLQTGNWLLPRTRFDVSWYLTSGNLSFQSLFTHPAYAFKACYVIAIIWQQKSVSLFKFCSDVTRCERVAVDAYSLIHCFSLKNPRFWEAIKFSSLTWLKSDKERTSQSIYPFFLLFWKKIYEKVVIVCLYSPCVGKAVYLYVVLLHMYR